jgi:hypothetical protein
MENASKASIHLQDLREKFLEFIALQGIYESFNAEIAENCAKSAKDF